MSKKEIVRELKHYLAMYAITPDEDSLNGILVYASMLVGAEL